MILYCKFVEKTHDFRRVGHAGFWLKQNKGHSAISFWTLVIIYFNSHDKHWWDLGFFFNIMDILFVWSAFILRNFYEQW